MKNIAIVGSRTLKNLDAVRIFIKSLPLDCTIISGGARGVDKVAADTAKELGMSLIEHLPDLTKCKTKSDFTRSYYERNQKIANDCDELYAFIDCNSTTHGTADTVKRAVSLGRKVKEFYFDNQQFLYDLKH